MEKTGINQKGIERKTNEGSRRTGTFAGNTTNKPVPRNESNGNRSLKIIGYTVVHTSLFEEQRFKTSIPPLYIKTVQQGQHIKKKISELYCELYGLISVNVSVELHYEG